MKGHLEVLASGKRSPPIFVRGEWGTGKTHLLSYIRTAASSRGLAGSKIDLNAHTAPLGHPQRFYKIMANLMVDQNTGLREILTWAFMHDEKRGKIAHFANGGSCADLRSPLLELCRLFEHDESPAFGNEPAWKALLGLI